MKDWINLPYNQLPDVPYELSYWKKATVHIAYHGKVEGHYYSVLHSLVKKKIEIRSPQRVVACFYRSKGVASHRRNAKGGCHTTVREHMPMEFVSNLIAFANIGPETLCLAKTLLVQRDHPQQAYCTLLGILRLGKAYGESRLESACRRALSIHALSYRSVASILKTWLDQKPLPETEKKPLSHPIFVGRPILGSRQV